MKFIVQDTFSIKKVLIFGGFGLCRFQHKVGMNSFPMRMNVISYGTNLFPWGMYSFRSKIPIVCLVQNPSTHHVSPKEDQSWLRLIWCLLFVLFPLQFYGQLTSIHCSECIVYRLFSSQNRR